MAIVRCPCCTLPLTDAEASAPVCPACANPLVDDAATPPNGVAAPEPAPPVKRGHRYGRILLAAMVIAVLSFAIVAIPRYKRDREEIALLRERAQSAEHQLRVLRTQAKQTPAAAAPSAADPVETLPVPEQQPAAEPDRAPKPAPANKESPPSAAAPLAFKELPPPKDNGQRVDGNVRIVADGMLRVITIDNANGDYRLPVLDNGAQVKLSGRLKTLRVDHISGATLDAGELTVGDIVFIGGINGGAKVKVNAQSSVTVPFIDSRSEVDIASQGGAVQVGWVNGAAQVRVLAREFTLRDYIDGRDTTVTATLTAAGRFQFREIRGKSRFLWKKAGAADPEVEYRQGLIRAPAEFRQIVPNG